MDKLSIAILSRNPRCYSTRRLREAILAKGHRARVFDPLKFGLYVESTSPSLTYRQRNVGDHHAVIPRIGASITFFGAAVVRQFEQMGVYSLTPSQSLLIARDKLRSLQILSRHDIDIAPSAYVWDRADVMPAIQRVGGAPVIIKLLEGTQGVGVILADQLKIAEAIVQTLQSTRQNVMVQKFVKESRGRDIRVLVVGDLVVAAMRRRAAGQEFRSNVHRGGTTEAVELDPAYARAAVRSAQILGLRVAGVDMLEGDDGPVIMEVNASPGLEGIEACSGVDVAAAIVDYLVEHVRFGDPDVRQRLSLARGFSVTEFTVSPDSGLSNCKIADSGLRERDIIVLSITRSGQTHAVPKGDDIIHSGDVLLCYGRKDTLRDYLPVLSKRRRRKSKSAPKRKS